MAVKVLSFYQDGCMGCLEQESINKEVEADLEIEIEAIDAKEHQEYISRYGLKVTPTTIILSDDQVVEKVEGILLQEEFLELLTKYL